MSSNIVSYALQYATLVAEGALVLYLAWGSQWKRRRGVALYASSLLVADLTRAWAVEKYGLTSHRYFYVYWSTDFLLVISAFVLVCLLFRRACFSQDPMWGHVRLMLLFVFALVLGVSSLSFSRHYSHLFTYFIIEFNQNLYFSCLVLNTLLYILLQHIESRDEELGLLVCGVGIQFAGPAASLALVHLTTGERFAQSLAYLTIPLCTLGMLLVWAYAIIRVKSGEIRVARPAVIPALAEVRAELDG
jgi:hypothetical protein